MQRLLIISFLLCFAVKLNSQGVNKLPDIYEIVSKFYGNYDISEYDYPYAGFEKKKDGWYVTIQQIENNRLITSKRFLFYSYKTHRFLSLPLLRNSESKKIKVSDYLDDFTLKGFKLQIYYGYKGWYKDVVKELTKKSKLTDDELNGLGRAYSTWAGGLVSDQYGDTPENEIWKLPFSVNCLSKSQIDSFNTIINKGQDCFRKLTLRNPLYQTAVGEISMKYANEIMYQNRILDAYAMEYAKDMKIPDNLYTKKQLNEAEEILSNCPENSIFVSFGDNDFYSLHYLQMVKNFRKDVYVINYNLMGIDRYVYRYSLGIHEAAPVQFSAHRNLYLGQNNDMVYIKDSAKSINVTELLENISDTSKYNQYGKATLFCDSIQISEKKNTGEKVHILSLRKAKYLFKNQWLLLDILNNLNGREICFGYQFFDELSGLNEFLTQKGNIWMYTNK